MHSSKAWLDFALISIVVQYVVRIRILQYGTVILKTQQSVYFLLTRSHCVVLIFIYLTSRPAVLWLPINLRFLHRNQMLVDCPLLVRDIWSKIGAMTNAENLAPISNAEHCYLLPYLSVLFLTIHNAFSKVTSVYNTSTLWYYYHFAAYTIFTLPSQARNSFYITCAVPVKIVNKELQVLST